MKDIEAEDIIKALTRKDLIEHITGHENYLITLKNINEAAVYEGEVGEVDGLWAWIPQEEFYNFVKEAIRKGENIIFASTVYESKGYNWMNDVASGRNARSYPREGLHIILKIKRESNNELDAEFNWRESQNESIADRL